MDRELCWKRIHYCFRDTLSFAQARQLGVLLETLARPSLFDEGVQIVTCIYEVVDYVVIRSRRRQRVSRSANAKEIVLAAGMSFCNFYMTGDIHFVQYFDSLHHGGGHGGWRDGHEGFRYLHTAGTAPLHDPLQIVKLHEGIDSGPDGP